MDLGRLSGSLSNHTWESGGAEAGVTPAGGAGLGRVSLCPQEVPSKPAVPGIAEGGSCSEIPMEFI